MYEELYKPLPDKSKYLERIGVTGPVAADAETLNLLVRAHQKTVPFENLDIYDAGADILLDIDILFDKVVNRRRGGYCFELNAAFMALLQSLGYDCYPVCARVVWMSPPGTYMPITHRAGIVTLGGTRYFIDVGFGGPSPHGALRLDEPGPQSDGRTTGGFDKAPDGDFIIYRVTESGREQLLKFSDRRCENVDFLAPNEYLSKNKNSGFKAMRMINITRDDGSAAINGNVLRVHLGGSVTETPLDTEEKLRGALAEYFGLRVDFPLKIS
jgi:N-hydroxyarylamine O-acetyltransferase